MNRAYKKQTRESTGLLFCICDREEYGRVTQVSIREIRFPNTHIRWAFADSYGFLFVGGLLAGWTFSPHLAAATE
jgi:hypothetical protein